MGGDAPGSTVNRQDASRTPVQSPADEIASPTKHRRWGCVIVPILLVGGLAAGSWYLITTGDVVETQIELMGNIDVRQVSLAFKVDGRIDQLRVDEGDSVKANDVLATLDKRYFNDELRILRAR